MRHRRDLAGLRLAAVEGAAEHVRLRAADRLQRAPELGRRRLVRDVAQLADEPAAADLVEALAGELEVVALHVDRPALVADDVDAALDAGDELLGRRAVRRRAAARRWPSAAPARGRGSRRRRSRWSARRRAPRRSAGPCAGRAGSRRARRRGRCPTPASARPRRRSRWSRARAASVRSPVTCITRRAVAQGAELVEGGERRAGVGRLVAERAVELGRVADRLVDGQPQVGRVDDQVVAAGLDARTPWPSRPAAPAAARARRPSRSRRR